MSEDKQIAETILAQLGGKRFIAMTGASSFSYGSKMLTFRLPTTRDFVKNKAKGVRITLDPNDLYTVEFIGQKRGPSFETFTVSSHSMVDCETLAPLFTSETGLATSL